MKSRAPKARKAKKTPTQSKAKKSTKVKTAKPKTKAKKVYTKTVSTKTVSSRLTGTSHREVHEGLRHKTHTSPSRMSDTFEESIERSMPRSWRNSSPSRVKAYYAMGAVALGLGLLFFAYQEIRSRKHDTAQNQTSSLSTKMTAAHHEVIQEKAVTPHYGGPLAAEFQNAHSLSFDERINYWSALLESQPEVRQKVAHLANGVQVNDTAPIVPKLYNCTTYVETVAALSRSEDPSAFVKHLVAIRYRDGEPGFTQRNHFPEVDWIPNNERAKILTDITEKVAQANGLEAKIERKEIDRGKWVKDQIRRRMISRQIASELSQEWKRPVKAQISYIDIRRVDHVIAKIPTGTVLNLVHKDDRHHPVLITHQGFVVRENGKVLLRHASRGGKIRTSNLSAYLRGLVKQQRSNSTWPLIGVNLNQINPSTSPSNLRSAAM